MKQPKVYVKELGITEEVTAINYLDEEVEVYIKQNAAFDDPSTGFEVYFFDDVEFIYNTGYKDMNDNYIYTGDIVVHNNLKYVVSKKTEEEFYYLEKNGKYCCRLSSMEDDYSVVGNIYENKDLLED